MSIFPPHDIETMNEDDVAGELIRPLCRALGYSQGNPDANLRSQVSLQYDKAFLGHKDGKKDPVLRGRPDFVCEVVSYTRWVVEAKKPSVILSLDDSFQAHTYSTHPEIAAEFYLLSNGRKFKLYRIANPEKPLMEWQKDETDDLLPVLQNILGPEAMKKRANVKIDLGKPLARGIGSKTEIVGGHVVYVKTSGSVPTPRGIDGLRNAVRGNAVYREESGLITAAVDVQSAFAEMDVFQDALGFNPLIFRTADEYLSTDVDNPTLLQAIINVDFQRGSRFPETPISPGGVIPVDVHAECYTEAVGFIEGNTFKGTFTIDYLYILDIPKIARVPNRMEMRTEGIFEVNFK
ncbi:type I restriction enzyme HsdR N-terminal domain-containing protein [Rhizobium chutanense]|uniref:Type I restriction endonuclease subunit R n=1 Tax=Rhizobium chutanense TaxID=2035448 RepID=A0A432P3L2_9HYPH|nr:type I restriction enzyme HsdR N-terminal domain-containing protein [Rhizobium chutanense]RUM06748.1 type I restriction endonuclease subunit R [Rhizobium chutanense]